METFYSVQGEGFHSGKPAYFIRVAGCDVGCHWCDVKESWDPNLHPLVKVDTIIKSILETNVKTVVITGGEPLMWNMEYLTKQLVKNNIQIHLETSGAYPLSGSFNWICLSPKKTMKPLLGSQKMVLVSLSIPGLPIHWFSHCSQILVFL